MKPRLSVAPMVGVTTRPHRYLCRLLSRSVTLYTEMIVSETILHGKDELVRNLLDKCADGEVVLQLAGRVPDNIAKAAAKAQEFGFSEINLNCGCPSKRAAVSGAFGLAMMKEPELVSEIIRTTLRQVSIPVTIKCRLGVDNFDSYSEVQNFIKTISDAGIRRVALHARKGILSMNTKGNRSIPPLKYDWVYSLCRDFPELKFDLNGGVLGISEAKNHMKECPALDGIMIGRAVWRNPLLLANADLDWFGKKNEDLPLTRRDLIERFVSYFNNKPEVPITESLEAIQGIFLGTPGSSSFRRTLANQRKAHCLAEIIYPAMETVPAETLDLSISDFFVNSNDVTVAW